MKYSAVVFAVLSLLAVQSFVCAVGGAEFVQLPDMQRGFAFSSQKDGTSALSTMADDWVSASNGFVQSITWWGSYWYHTDNATYYSGMQQNAPNGDISSFVIEFWTDVPANPNVACSSPGQVIRAGIYEIPFSQANETYYGRINYNDFGYRDVFRYGVTLPQGFAQAYGVVYWVSIRANLSSAAKQWGWLNSNEHRYAYATQEFVGSDWYPPSGGTDMAFGLGTENPPPTGVPGYDVPADHHVVLSNPYGDDAPQSRLKGQIHCHYYNDAERTIGPWQLPWNYVGMRGIGSLNPSLLLSLYGTLGYDFVCITEHSHCTTDPTLQVPLPIKYCEEVTNGFGHVLAIGINPAWKSFDPNDYRYFPWDLFATVNGMAEVEDFGCDNLPSVCQKIFDWGGIAIVAHPSGPACAWDDTIIDSDKLTAVSIYNSASKWLILGEALYPALTVDHWQNLLGLRKSVRTPGDKVMPLFCASEDDFAPPFAYYAQGRTWALVDCPNANPSQGDIVEAMKQGHYWVYWAEGRHFGTGPKLTLSTTKLDDGSYKIAVTSDQELDSITFIGMRKHLGPGPLPSVTVSPTGAYCICYGSEGYVRIEAVRGDIHIYSQAIGVNWEKNEGGGLRAQGMSADVQPLASPSDLTLTCALPEDLPAKSPPLGYIGRAYFVSTTGGTYPPDATFTLSYEGLDVTPYGASNLAIYRWDATAADWLKLISTVDAGNALVTAPLTQAGLYTISAKVVGDATPPVVTIHTPSDNATLTGPDVVGVQATDNVGVQSVSFYLGNQCIGTDSTSYDGFTCSYDFGKKSAGQYILKAVAEDVSGNTDEAQVTVNISSSGVTPTVAIATPANGATLGGTTPITGTCGDDSLVAGVFVSEDGIPVGEANVTGGTWAYQLDTSKLADGPHTLSAVVMDDNQNTSEQGIGVTINGSNLASLSAARMLADGEQARLSGRVVTFGNPGTEGAFYIEEQNRSSGVRVEGSRVPAEGDMVTMSGLMSTREGERALVGADVNVLSSSNPVPPPVALANIMLGGGAFGDYVPGITGGFGLNNTGLLIRAFGKVTQKGSGFLYVDDGSNLKDGTLTGTEENLGVRVVCDPTDYNRGDFLVVTGISSCFEPTTGVIARRILTRWGTDINRIAVGL